jgi:hypothetical protein
MAKPRRWYDFCVTFQRLDEAARAKCYRSNKTRTAFARIAGLARHQGLALDKAGAPLRCLIWVAYAPDTISVPMNLAQQTRCDAVTRFHAQRARWPLSSELTILRIKLWERLHGHTSAASEEVEVEELAGTAAGTGSPEPAEGAANADIAGLLRAMAVGFNGPGHAPARADLETLAAKYARRDGQEP